MCIPSLLSSTGAQLGTHFSQQTAPQDKGLWTNSEMEEVGITEAATVRSE